MRAIIGSLLLLFLASLLSACGASESTVATAIALTHSAAPTTTPVPPTATPTPAPSETPEPTTTATPDVRVYDVDPGKLVLGLDEMPLDGKWWMYHDTPHKNSEILAARGNTEGGLYLEESGRLGGWIRELGRGTRQVRVPEWVDLYPVVFRDAAGPLWLLDDYADNDGCDTDPIKGKAFTRLSDAVGLGDQSFACVWKEMQSSGKNYLIYDVIVIDRNVWTTVRGYGLEDEFDLSALIEIASVQDQKLQEFPLTSEVTVLP